MSEHAIPADATFSQIAAELLSKFGDKTVPLKNRTGMFLGASALPIDENTPHVDSFDYRLKVLTYDTSRTERISRVYSRAPQAGFLAVTSTIEHLDRNHIPTARLPIGTDLVAEEACVPELRDLAQDALPFERTLRLEKYVTSAVRSASL